MVKSERQELRLQLALVLILVQILRADMEIRDDELEAVIGAVQDVLGRGRDEDGQRLRLLEWLWRIPFADAEIVAQEEYRSGRSRRSSGWPPPT